MTDTRFGRYTAGKKFTKSAQTRLAPCPNDQGKMAALDRKSALS